MTTSKSTKVSCLSPPPTPATTHTWVRLLFWARGPRALAPCAVPHHFENPGPAEAGPCQKRASSRFEAGTSGFLSISDSDRSHQIWKTQQWPQNRKTTRTAFPKPRDPGDPASRVGRWPGCVQQRPEAPGAGSRAGALPLPAGLSPRQPCMQLAPSQIRICVCV